MSKNFTLADYVDNIKETFQYWLDLHTDPETWAEEWACDSIQFMFKESPTLSTNYFTFDWQAAAIKAYAKNNLHLFDKCSNCGTIYDIGMDDEDCCDNVQRDAEPSLDELIFWLTDLGTDWMTFSDDELMDALINDGFPVYQEAMSGIIDSVVDEVKEVLRAIESANSNEELLPIIAWANHVLHVNGNIMRDYSRNPDIGYGTIDTISQDGLNSLFSDEEIREFVSAQSVN